MMHSRPPPLHHYPVRSRAFLFRVSTTDDYSLPLLMRFLLSARLQQPPSPAPEDKDTVGESPETLTALHTQWLQEQPATNKNWGVPSSLPFSLSSAQWKVGYPSDAEPSRDFQGGPWGKRRKGSDSNGKAWSIQIWLQTAEDISPSWNQGLWSCFTLFIYLLDKLRHFFIWGKDFEYACGPFLPRRHIKAYIWRKGKKAASKQHQWKRSGSDSVSITESSFVHDVLYPICTHMDK